jgi:hypothetical protein
VVRARAARRPGAVPRRPGRGGEARARGGRAQPAPRAGLRPEEADADRIHDYAARYAELPLWRALAARLAHELGDGAAARAAYAPLAAGGFTAVDGDPDQIATLALLADPVAAGGARAEADALYGLLLPYRDRNVVIERGWAAWGSAERPLGVLAAARGDAGAAEAHHRAAAERDAAWGAPPWAARRPEVPA